MKIFNGKFLKRICAGTAAAALMLWTCGDFPVREGISVYAEANAASSETGAFTVTGGTSGSDYTYENNMLTIKTATALTISGTSTTDRIEVASGVSANVTLDGVNIDVSGTSGAAAFKITNSSKGNVTVTLEGTNTLKSGKNCAGLQKGSTRSEEPTDAGTLTITGTGSLTATGGENAAGIGGGGTTSGSDSNCNAHNITIESGTIKAYGGSTGAGIGSGNGGYCTVTIKGGCVEAIGGGSKAAGIGAGGGNTWGGSNTIVKIEGGTVVATGGNGSYGGAGIGGAGNYYNTTATVTISGGIVTAIGGTGSSSGGGAGIGGTGGSKNSANINVTISGGVVTATGGNGSTGSGDGIGSGGDSTNNNTSFSTNNGSAFIVATGGISGDVSSAGNGVIVNGETTIWGADSYILNQSVNIPNGATLTIPNGKTLTINGTLTNNGTLTVERGGILNCMGTVGGSGTCSTAQITEDMISVPTNLIYNGTDLSETIKAGTKIIIGGKEFTAEGWTLSVTQNSDLEYTVTYAPSSGGTAITKTVIVSQSGATVTATSDKQEYAYNDTITINATVTPTGEAPAVAMLAANFDEPTAGQMAVYDGDKQVCEPATPENGACTFTIPAKDLGAGEHTLTVKYVESDVMAEATVEVSVLNVAACTHENVTDGKCVDCEETITAMVEIGGVTTNYTDITSAWNAVQGKTATVTLLADQTVNETLNVSDSTDIVLNSNYTLTCTSENCINVTGGTLKITRGTYTGNTCGLYVSGGNVMLAGGIFNDIKTSGGKFLDSLLADGYAYKLDGSVWIEGTYVKTCMAFNEYLTSSYTKAEVLKLPIKNANATPETAEVTYGYTTENAPVLTVTTTATGTPAYQWWELNENGNVKSRIDGATTETLTVPTGLSMGKYIFGCIVSLDGFNRLSTSATVTVQPKPLTITGATLAAKTYDGETTATVTDVTLSGFVGSDSLTYGTDYTATAEFTDENAGTDKTVTVTVTLADTVTNYTLAQNTFTLTGQTIEKATQTLTAVSDSYQRTYGDSAFTLDCTTDGDGKITYSSDNENIITVSENGTVTIIGAGNASITVSLAEGGNYTGTDSKTISVAVAKAANPPTMPDSSITVPYVTETVGAAPLPDGWSWSVPDTQLTVGETTNVTAVYEDRINYQNTEATIAVTRENCSHETTEIADAKEPNCTEKGYTGDTVCTVCKATIKQGEEIPAKGHSGGTATCTEKAVCGVCNTGYGELAPHNYVLKHDAVNHWSECGGCGDKKDTAAHVWDEGKVTTEPTCSKTGVKTFTCECGEIRTETVPATGEHTWDEGVITKAATCTENGIKTFTCDCGETKTEEIPATGHTEEIVTAVPANCTETGLTEGKKCSVCHTVIVEQEVIPAKGHTEEIVPAVPANCTETGFAEGKKCSVCQTVIVAQQVIPATGHIEVIIPAVPANCTNTGLTEGKKCSVCGIPIKEQTVTAALGHKWDSGIVTLPPDEENDGIMLYTCTACGETKNEVISKLNHTHIPDSTWDSDNDSHWHNCSGCSEKLEFGSHIWDGGIVNVQPTETAEGVRTYTCLTCGKTKTEAVPKLDHTHTPDGAWLFDDHTHWHNCSGCGEKLDTAAHTWDSGVITVQPTENSEGVKTYTCSVCGNTKTEPVVKLDHTHKFDAIWHSDSINHWHECVCGEKSDVSVHTEDGGTVTKPATIEETGIMTYFCSVCRYKLREETIDKLPPVHTHEYGTAWSSDRTNHWHECVCGEKSNVSLHTADNGIVTVQPTETTAGTRTFKCTVCGYVIRTETIPPTGYRPDPTPTPTPIPTPTPTPTPTPSPSPVVTTEAKNKNVPYIEGNNGKSGWEAISEEIVRTGNTGTVTVDMNGTTELPKNITEEIAGKNIVLVLDMGGGISWTINGLGVTNAKAVDMSVKKNTKNIPVDVINNVSGESTTIQISLAHNGTFGFTAELNIELGKKNDGLYANLFYYNTDKGELEFADCSIIENGKASIEFTHASDYAIIIDSEPLGAFEDVAAAAGALADGDDLPKTAEKNNAMCVPIIGAVVVIIVGAGWFVKRKKKE